MFSNTSIEKTLTIKSSAIEIYDWKNVEFVNEEWDTQLKINQLNKIDAAYNNIDIQKLIEIIK